MSVKLLKFADKRTVICPIQQGEQLVLWCSQKNLKRKTLKTVEMTLNFRRSLPNTILKNTVSTVETFRFLEPSVSQDLRWTPNITSVMKAQQRMYFLHQLRKSISTLQLWYKFNAIIQAVVCTSIIVWFGSAKEQTAMDHQNCRRNHWGQPALHLGLIQLQTEETDTK